MRTEAAIKNDKHPPQILLLSARLAAESLGISRASFYSLHSAGKVPLPRRLGKRVLWSVEELKDWIAAGCPCREKWEQLKGKI